MTIKEVAKLAGVSPAAVSRYLNGGSISEEKKERVRRAIEETGYRPNPMARTMRTGRINQVGIIVPRIHSDSVSQITASATRKLAERGFMPLLGCTDQEREHEREYIHIMQEKQVAGIILMGTVMTPEILQAARGCRVPVVITGQNCSGVPCVYHDDFHAVKDLTGLMIRRGRRRLVMISAPQDDIAVGLNRCRGARRALQEAGLDPDSLLVETSGFDFREAREAMIRLLRQRPDLDGVICATDMMAMGAMMALREAGKRIPEDVSIAGVGDSWFDEVSTPSLTTAHLFFHQCGEDAARLLLELIDKGSGEENIRQICLQYKIVERGSI